MKLLIILIAITLLTSNCSKQEDRFTFNKRHFDVVMEENTHGGFHGDGQYCLVLDCSDNREKALQNVESWKKFPLPENLQLVAYGGMDPNGYKGSSLFPEEVKIPEIENGYYYFYDRHSETVDPSDDSKLYERYSYNFDFAIYDADNAMLYYLREDT